MLLSLQLIKNNKMKDFTLHSYEQLLCKIGPRDCTLLHYLTNNDSEYIIRHDVDKSLSNALEMAVIESQYKIKSSYYFRVKPNLFNKDIINKIYALGHEIGYHYEVMDKAKGDLISAKKLFGKEWSLFKEWNSKTVAMHGNPLTSYNNLDFWKNNNLSDYDVKGEAYLSVDFDNIKYFTDTGRGWNTSVSFKDKGNKVLIKIDSTSNLIEYINKTEDRYYIMTHPQYWSNNRIIWIKIKFLESIKNIIKRIIKNN